MSYTELSHPLDLEERISVMIVMQRPLPLKEAITKRMNEIECSDSLVENHMSHEQFFTLCRTPPEHFEEVEKFAERYDLKVENRDALAGTMELSGKVKHFNEVFKIKLMAYNPPNEKYRGYKGELHIPEPLHHLIETVLDLDNSAIVRPDSHTLKGTQKCSKDNKGITVFTAPEVAEIYNFPNILFNQQTIAIIELAGGFLEQDIIDYFNIVNLPVPEITVVSVDGAQNNPGVCPEADMEVTLDIDTAGAASPGAKIIVYFAPNTPRGFLNALTTVINDNINNPSVLSMSIATVELLEPPGFIRAFNQRLQEAGSLGITACASSGDIGSQGVLDGSTGQVFNVDFPASSPFALGVGGTSLRVQRCQKSCKEVVWNNINRGIPAATGGGVSDVFMLPAYQFNAGVPRSANPDRNQGRGVPDVAANADPSTGYLIIVDDQFIIGGGTSASAPLWAGLIANLNQALGRRLGFVNPIFYQLCPEDLAFNDITIGNNNVIIEGGPYVAKEGWDPCTGLGSPDGTKLLEALQRRCE
ncbi:protease pro-enzyme activation domain-containing protein [Chengkuizengella sp. SCS-71B]|uniref:S53 family peptidase n=1 Tax=Chengkuizengella sp. SCS-71B TaxID=3115290 RepID=UPI0032C23105